jgi:DNA-binding beta-propeller fold protein YncE
MSNTKDFKVRSGIQPTVYQEGVGTVVSGSVGYNLAGASYDSKSFNVSSQTTNPYGLRISQDGTRVIILDKVDSNLVQYNLSTAYDITTAVAQGTEFSLSTQTPQPMGIAVSNSGAKVYVSTETEPDNIYQYDLSTSWDVSTASYSGNSFSPQTQAASSSGIYVKEDGTKLYVRDITTNAVYQYTMSTPYDVSTASYDSKSLSVSSQSSNGYGITFSTDGLRFFITDINDNIYQYNLSTAWDISTGTYSSTSFSVTSQESTVLGLDFSNSGQKMYIVGQGSDTIYQYSTVLTTASLDLSSGSVFDYTPTSDVQVTLTNPAASGTSSGATLLLTGAGTTGYDLVNASYSGKSFNVAGQDTVPTHTAFNTNGTKMYVTGLITDTVYQYSLSTAFEVNTASYDSVSFSVASQMNNPRGTVFNTDGTKMYIVDGVNLSVYQYSLSTAFDLSTASYDSVSFSVASQENSPFDLAFNNAGTKMYVTGQITDSVYQYSLSTAFDLSTASYDSVSFSVASQALIPYSIAFNPTGSKMFILDNNTKNVFQYSLSTAFNLSTASYDTVSFTITQMTNPVGMVFNTNGTKMYVVGTSNDTIYQYSTASPATITYDPDLQWPSGTAPTSPAIGETDVITFNTTDGGTTYKSVQSIDGAK